MQTFVYALHFIACFVLISVVLLQRGKGADLGASLGGGGANTIFGSRGAGNFLTKITTGSAIVFMGTSLTLSYLGYQASDVQLFDGTDPIELPGSGSEGGGLQEIVPDESEGGLVEIPTAESAAAALEEVVDDASDAAAAAGESIGDAIGEAAGSAESALDSAGDALGEAPLP